MKERNHGMDRILNAFRRGRMNAEIDEEVQFHIDERTRDNVAAGMTPDVWTANLLNGSMAQNTSVPNWQDWKAQAHTFEDMAAYRESDGPLADPTQATIDTEWIDYAWVSLGPGARALRSSRV